MPDIRRVLVTGGTGYIAKHIIAKLLSAGFAVRATARTSARFDEIRAAVGQVVPADTLAHLDFATLDLSQDDGWAAAREGIDIVMHTASPFPMNQPKDEQALIKPAVEGALRAVRAAKDAGIARFIMTSSTAAITGPRPPDGKTAFDEECWCDIELPGTSPYVKSKTLAERAVWDWAADHAPDMNITMINPGFVQGPPLDANFGTSIAVIERAMRGKDPMVPNFGFLTVDVEDVAELHVAVIDKTETHGQRVLAVERFIWFAEFAHALKAAFPTRRIATRTAPDFLIRFLALFDPAIRSIVPQLALEQRADNTRAREILGRPLSDPIPAVVAVGAFLEGNKLV